MLQRFASLLLCCAINGAVSSQVYEREKDSLNMRYVTEYLVDEISGDTNIWKEGFIKNDRKEGVWIRYDENGRIKLKGEYSNNRPSGFYQKYYSNGQLKESGYFKQRNFYGLRETFYRSGCLQSQVRYNAAGKEDSMVTFFYDDCDSIRKKGSIEWVYKAINGVPYDTAYHFLDDAVEVVLLKEDGDKQVVYLLDEQSTNDSTYLLELPPKVNVADGTCKLLNHDENPVFEGYCKGGRAWTGKYYFYDDEGILLDTKCYHKGIYIGKCL